MTKRLSQATLNTYLDYYNVTGTTWTRRDPTNTTFVPTNYGRASDLHFRSGVTWGASGILGSPTGTTSNAYASHGVFFFAPLGFTDNNASYRDLPNLLNPIAYFVEFADSSTERPQFLQNANLPKRYRYRLVEVVAPAQNFTGYPALTGTDITKYNDWITGTGGLKTSAYKHLLADNIIALVIRPELASQQDATAAGLTSPWNLTTNYSYNSRAGRSTTTDALQFAQLPPLLRITMVAVDEAVAARLSTGSTPPAALDTTLMKDIAGNPLFSDPNNYDSDINTLETKLSAARVQFRTFTSVISLRAAKWSAGN